MNISAVIGLGYGDEGKGSFTQHLSSLNFYKNNKTLIIRFNGGHQAGHTVTFGNVKHIFSSFGSGTLLGHTTFWSKFCTMYPIALFNEYYVLKEKGYNPKIIFDPMCPITTPYDVYSNKKINDITNHGSVGVGFGTTLKRQEDNYKLHYCDLFNKTVLKVKIDSIKKYYESIHGEKINIDDKIEIWYKCIDSLIEEKIMTETILCGANSDRSENTEKGVVNIRSFTDIIFEGAQGILLDMDHGFFPNVTRSNTTTKNIYTIMLDLHIGYSSYEKLKIFYITRCYQTRHGNGFLSNENLIPELINTSGEINLDTSYQGSFRKSILDFDMIKYALKCDSTVEQSYFIGKKNIVLTCLDQLPNGQVSYTRDGVVYTKTVDKFIEILKNETGLDIYSSSKEGYFNYDPNKKTGFSTGFIDQTTSQELHDIRNPYGNPINLRGGGRPSVRPSGSSYVRSSARPGRR